MDARVIQVIEVHGRRGVGTADDPHRIVIAYFTLEGDLLAERDAWKEAEALRAKSEREKE